MLSAWVVGPDSFDPTYSMIVRNKDEFTLPLDFETIPTPKEFKDAIASLSPEQQEFCKAFRGMQLESTLFGVVVIQIKPQLEKLLQLTPNSLAKEIQLTEHLMELFIKYQIPSDLLAFEQGDHPVSVTLMPASQFHNYFNLNRVNITGLIPVWGWQVSERDPQRLEQVKSHVAAMYSMINEEKDREEQEKKQEVALSPLDAN